MILHTADLLLSMMDASGTGGGQTTPLLELTR
jgi:hypothetical protein